MIPSCKPYVATAPLPCPAASRESDAVEPQESFVTSAAPAAIYGPKLMAGQGKYSGSATLDGRTFSSRVAREPASVDSHSNWTQADHAHLLPVDRSGQPWSLDKLSKKGPELIRQGPLGDCYHEAPLASALQEDPRLITSTTQLLGSKKGIDYYGVVFYLPADHQKTESFDRAGDDVTQVGADGASKTYTPVWVVVDNLLPAHADGSLITSAVEIPEIHQNVLLGAIREKALAALHGKSGYRNITHGGDADKIMETLSGYPSSILQLARSKDPVEDKKLANEQFATLLTAHQNLLLTSVNTHLGDTRQVRKILRDTPEPAVKGYPPGYFDPSSFVFRDGNGDASSTAGTGQAAGKDSRTGYGWVGCHEYFLLDVYNDENGVKMVKIRNPWGDVCPPEFADKDASGKPRQNGIVNIPWYLARQLLDTVKIGGRPASEHDQDVSITQRPKQGLPPGLEAPAPRG